MKMTDKIRRLLAKGASTAEIAKKLKIKPAYVHTVKWLDKKAKAKQKVQVERSHDPKVVEAEKEYLRSIKQAMDTIQKKPTKLLVQPQYKDTALKLLGMKEADPVNHPPHYKSGGIETIDFIEAKDLNYRLGNVVKYVSRAGKKGDPLQDLEKAAWYLQREITARKNA
jgi:hypothetical protein